jgi:hypothetical protein
MRFRFTIILLLLNVLAFGWIVYLDRRGEPDTSARGNLAGAIAREVVDADRIELHWQRRAQPRILERSGSHWYLREPIQWPANAFAVSRLLNQLQFIEEEAAFAVAEIERTGQTLADYGLEEPAVRLIIAAGDSSISLAIGAPTEIGNKVYMMGPDQRRIYVVNRAIINDLTLDVEDLRSQTVFEIPVFEVNTLSLSMQATNEAAEGILKTRLARTQNNWYFEAPIAVEANPQLVNDTLNALVQVKANRFIESGAVNLAVMGLETPSMEITLQGNRRRQTLLLGATDSASRQQAYFARLEDNPTVFTVPAAPFDALREAQDALRQRNFVQFNPNMVSGIAIGQNGLSIRLQKLETGDWQIIQTNDSGEVQTLRADAVVITDLLQGLRELRAVNFAADTPSNEDIARFGFERPRRSVRLSRAGETILDLLLGHPEDENERLYAKTDATFIYEVRRRALLDLLPLNAMHYRDRTLERLPSAAVITNIQLTEIASDTILIDEKIDPNAQTWPLYLGDKYEEPKVETLLQLVDYLRRPQAERFIRNEFQTENRLDTENPRPWIYRLDYSVRLPGGENARVESRSLFLSERLGGTSQAASTESFNATFFIPPALIEILENFIDPIADQDEAVFGDDNPPAEAEPLAPVETAPSE